MSRLDKDPSAVSPAKLATIVALGIVLVIVLVVQFSGGSSEPAVLKRRVPRNTVESGPASTSNTADSQPALVARVHWPEIPRQEVASFNPFAVPFDLRGKVDSSTEPVGMSHLTQITQSSSSGSKQTTGTGELPYSLKPGEEQARIRAQAEKSRLERVKATASSLQKQGVGLVVRTSSGAVARLGEQELRVGDVINGVLQIVAIDPRGIVVEEIPEVLAGEASGQGSQPSPAAESSNVRTPSLSQ